MTKSIFLISALAIFTFYACQNNHSSENDEKNDTQQDTEVVKNNQNINNKNDNETGSKISPISSVMHDNHYEFLHENYKEGKVKLTSEENELIKFIKDEFYKLEDLDNLKKLNFSYEEKVENEGSDTKFYEAVKYYDENENLKKIKYKSMYYETSFTQIFYFNNNELYFYFCSCGSYAGFEDHITEKRYYLHNGELIKMLLTKKLSIPIGMDRNDNYVYGDTSVTSEKKIISKEELNDIFKYAENLKQMQSNKDFEKLLLTNEIYNID